MLLALLAWLDREQRDVIAYLREENRAATGSRRLRLVDRAAPVSGGAGTPPPPPPVAHVATLVTPTRFSDGTARLLPESGPTPGSAPADLAYDAKSGVWWSAWRPTIRAGVTRGSKVR